MPPRVIVRLESLHIEVATKVARRRRQAAIDRHRQAHNGAPTEDCLKLDILGCLGEVAAKLYYNPVKWHAYADRIHDLPDLDTFIDVKARSETWQDLMVQRDDRPEWAYVLVTPAPHPDYALYGWLWGHEAKLAKYWIDPAGGRPAFFVKQRLLRDVQELTPILRARQTARE